MVSLRYHIVSVGAVFLALAVGVVLGSTALSGRLLAGLNSDREQLAEQVSDLQARNDALNRRADAVSGFVAAVGPQVVSGVLDGRSVLLVSTASADPADRKALSALLDSAGATVTGRLRLTAAFTDPDRSNQLIELTTRLLPAGLTLPPTPRVGTLVGSLLGSLLLVDQPSGVAPAGPADAATVLAGLRDGGYLAPADNIEPAQLVIVLTGSLTDGGRAAQRAQAIVGLATALDRAGAGAVLAGRAPDGPIGLLRAGTAATPAVSTVDHVGTPVGRVTTVLALAEQARGGAGNYGIAASAESAVPVSAG